MNLYADNAIFYAKDDSIVRINKDGTIKSFNLLEYGLISKIAR